MGKKTAKVDLMNQEDDTDRQLAKIAVRPDSHYLSAHTGWTCKIMSDPGTINVNPQDPEHTTLVLLDCPERDPVKYSVLAVSGKRVLSKCLVLLFNVKIGLGIEERAVTWGIRGFFYETDSIEQMVKGIQCHFQRRDVAFPRDHGQCLMSQRSNSDPSSKKEVVFLTQRELEILSMVVSGATNEEIAARVCISPPYSENTHLQHLQEDQRAQPPPGCSLGRKESLDPSTSLFLDYPLPPSWGEACTLAQRQVSPR